MNYRYQYRYLHVRSMHEIRATVGQELEGFYRDTFPSGGEHI